MKNGRLESFKVSKVQEWKIPIKSMQCLRVPLSILTELGPLSQEESLACRRRNGGVLPGKEFQGPGGRKLLTLLRNSGSRNTNSRKGVFDYSGNVEATDSPDKYAEEYK